MKADSHDAKKQAAAVKKAAKQKVAHKKIGEASIWARFNACMTSTRNYLN